MIQHLNSTMHRNKPTLISCFRCKEEILCQTQNDVLEHSCHLSNILYQSIHSENSPVRGKNDFRNPSNISRFESDAIIVNDCEVIGNDTSSDIQNID